MKNSSLVSKILVSSLIILFISCGKTENLKDNYQNITSIIITDTIQNLSEMKTDKVIWNDNGIYRVVFFEESNDPLEENGPQANKATCSPLFSGIDRRDAKISFSPISQTTYSTLNSFRNSLQTDTFMLSLGISTSSTSIRVSQENRNVNISTSYLYAIKSESDGDLHMIIGDASKVALTNCEASGLPASSASSYTKINAVKNAIVTRFATDFCGKSSYTIFSPPVLINVLKGSLFFDVDHAAGVIGPTGYRPTSAWEIHPISLITF